MFYIKQTAGWRIISPPAFSLHRPGFSKVTSYFQYIRQACSDLLFLVPICCCLMNSNWYSRTDSLMQALRDKTVSEQFLKYFWRLVLGYITGQLWCSGSNIVVQHSTHLAYRSCLAMENQATKLTVHSFCVDFNARWFGALQCDGDCYAFALGDLAL